MASLIIFLIQTNKTLKKQSLYVLPNASEIREMEFQKLFLLILDGGMAKNRAMDLSMEIDKANAAM